MESQSHYWTGRWTDHLIDAFHLDSDAILARHAETLKLGYLEGVHDDVLVLSRIDVEGVRENPEGTSRLLQASYEATLRLVTTFSGQRAVNGLAAWACPPGPEGAAEAGPDPETGNKRFHSEAVRGTKAQAQRRLTELLRQ